MLTKLASLSPLYWSHSLTTEIVAKCIISLLLSLTTCPHAVRDVGPEGGDGEESQSVEEEEAGGRDQEDQPEPEEEVELLVDDVVGKDTYGLQYNQ